MDPKYFTYGIIAALIIVVSLISIYFGKEMLKATKENNEYTVNTTGTLEFVIVHVKWCPYSKQALEIWNLVTPNFNGLETPDGKKITFKEIDDDESTATPLLHNKKIEAYPTIYCEIDKEKQIEFKSKCTNKTLTSFIKDLKENN